MKVMVVMIVMMIEFPVKWNPIDLTNNKMIKNTDLIHNKTIKKERSTLNNKYLNIK